jgi:hypothetical protein
MPQPDFRIATDCLHDNLVVLADTDGTVPPNNRALWNISNALIVICDALQEMQGQLKKIEQQQ